MCFFFSLVPATVLIVIGYFVLFSSTKTEGKAKVFGQILAIWIFIVAMIPVILGTYMTLSGLCPIGKMFKMMGTGA